MPEPIQRISHESYSFLQSNIESTIAIGTSIRDTLAPYSNQVPYDTNWEVLAAVEALHVFGSRWTIEILSTLYIAGPRRFNEMKNLLEGISSRTLSDKLRSCQENGLVERVVFSLIICVSMLNVKNPELYTTANSVSPTSNFAYVDVTFNSKSHNGVRTPWV